MKLDRAVVVLASFFGLAGCASGEAQPTGLSQEDVENAVFNSKTGSPTNPSKVRLPDYVKIVSDRARNFGIDVSKLEPEHASIVASAWLSYETVWAGGEPLCWVAYAASDGGSATYFCDGFTITRVHSLSSQGDVSGYKYGPMLDLLNGQEVQRLKFYSYEQMAELERVTP